MLDTGFGLAPGVVVLPDPSRRLNPDTGPAIARFARRMAPAVCLGMDADARLEFRDRRLVAGRGRHLRQAGVVDPSWTATVLAPGLAALGDSAEELPR